MKKTIIFLLSFMILFAGCGAKTTAKTETRKTPTVKPNAPPPSTIDSATDVSSQVNSSSPSPEEEPESPKEDILTGLTIPEFEEKTNTILKEMKSDLQLPLTGEQRDTIYYTEIPDKHLLFNFEYDELDQKINSVLIVVTESTPETEKDKECMGIAMALALDPNLTEKNVTEKIQMLGNTAEKTPNQSCQEHLGNLRIGVAYLEDNLHDGSSIYLLIWDRFISHSIPVGESPFSEEEIIVSELDMVLDFTEKANVTLNDLGSNIYFNDTPKFIDEERVFLFSLPEQKIDIYLSCSLKEKKVNHFTIATQDLSPQTLETVNLVSYVLATSFLPDLDQTEFETVFFELQQELTTADKPIVAEDVLENLHISMEETPEDPTTQFITVTLW